MSTFPARLRRTPEPGTLQRGGSPMVGYLIPKSDHLEGATAFCFVCVGRRELDEVRAWPDLGGQIGECRVCGSTLVVNANTDTPHLWALFNAYGEAHRVAARNPSSMKASGRVRRLRREFAHAIGMEGKTNALAGSDGSSPTGGGS
jgi:hypothetical protein